MGALWTPLASSLSCITRTSNVEDCLRVYGRVSLIVFEGVRVTTHTAVRNFNTGMQNLIEASQKSIHLPDYKYLYNTCIYVCQVIPVDSITSFVTDKMVALKFCEVYNLPVKVGYNSMKYSKETERAKIDMLRILNNLEHDILASF